MRECNICNEVFTNNRTYSNHVRWKHTPIVKIKCEFCSESFTNNSITRHRKYCKSNPTSNKLKKCKSCGVDFYSNYNQFCSQTCSAKYNNTGRVHSVESKQKTSKSIKVKWVEGAYKNVFKNVDYATLPRFTSKPEKAIFNFFKEAYPEDGWTCGGGLKLEDGVYLSRDMYSDKLKICFEYDGIWHFKDIYGQLERKQYKDKLLNKWCKVNNYKLIRLDEECFINPEQVANIVYNSTIEDITLIGNRYSYLNN
jgi:hypothetical protein